MRFRACRQPRPALQSVCAPERQIEAVEDARGEIGAVLAGLRDLVAQWERTGPARPGCSNFLSGIMPLALKGT